MNASIAQHNAELLSQLVPYQKLRTDADGRFHIDDRMFQGIRRGFTGDSRDSVVGTIQATFDALSLSVTNIERVVLSAQLLRVFNDTYPGYLPLRDALIGIMHKYNCETGRKLNAPIVVDTPTLSKLQEQLLIPYSEGKLSTPLWNLLQKDDNRAKAIASEVMELANVTDTLLIFDIHLHTNSMCKLTLTNVRTGVKTYKVLNYEPVSYAAVTAR